MKIVECHYYHIVSKITLCSLLIIILILTIDKVLIISTLDFKMTNGEKSLSFFLNTFETDKIFSVLLSTFIYGYSFTNQQDSYRSFILINNISRKKYFLTKVFTIIIVIFIYDGLLFISSILILMLKEIYFLNIFISGYYSLFILMNFYGLVSLLLVQLSNNFYLIILPFMIYLLSASIVMDSQSNNSVMLVIMPNGIINNGYYYGVMLIIILLILNIFIYLKRDLQVQ